MMDRVHHTMEQQLRHMMVRQHQAAPVLGILLIPTLHLGEYVFAQTLIRVIIVAVACIRIIVIILPDTFVYVVFIIEQGGHKPGIFRNFSEFCATSGKKIVTNKVFLSLRHR